MKKLIWFTVLMTLGQGFMIWPQILSDNSNNGVIVIGILFIIAFLIHFFIEYKKLNKLK